MPLNKGTAIKSKGMKGYSTEFKYRVLTELVNSGYRINETAKKFNIGAQTLNSWKNSLPHVLESINESSINRYTVQKQINSANLHTHANQTAIKVIEKGLSLIEQEKNLDKISNFLKALTPFAKAIHSQESTESEDVQSITVTLNKIGKIRSLNSKFDDAEIVE